MSHFAGAVSAGYGVTIRVKETTAHIPTAMAAANEGNRAALPDDGPVYHEDAGPCLDFRRRSAQTLEDLLAVG